MKAEEIKIELEKNYGWNFSSEENMEMYYELFSDVQKVVLHQPDVIKSVCVCQNRQDQFKRGDIWICSDCEEEIKQTVL